MGGFKESLDGLTIYRLQSKSGQSIQNSSFSDSKDHTSPFERRYLVNRHKEQEASIKASNFIDTDIPTNRTSNQSLSASQSSLENLASHFNKKRQSKVK
jgi:hypothetical protein